ncbi:MAG: hypothetical protein JXA11_05965 [Phycisphaerae bacterium]|nr:hypothetical protein [Phycisphaerae bacterium]
MRNFRFTLLIAGVILAAHAFATPGQAMSLSAEQRMAVLTEAQQDYDTALRLEATQPAAAQKVFRQSAEKFQLVIETGPCDGELYRRSADACLRSGQIGSAIANYQRAKQLSGPTPEILTGLTLARSLRDGVESPALVPPATFWGKLSLWNRALSLPGRFRVGLFAWVGVWIFLGVSLLARPRVCRVSAAVCGVVFVLLTASVLWDVLPEWNQTRGVVTATNAPLRAGNGETFAAQTLLKDGAEFDLLEQRGRWLHVALTDGNTGWIDARHTQRIPPRRELWG